MNGPSSLQHSLNLNKNLHSENTNLNVNMNVESNGYAGSEHYSEVDKTETSSPSPNPQSWPEDLQGNESLSTATYANVVSRGLPSSPAPPPPPVGPNESPTKPKNNFDIAQSLNEMTLDAKNQSPKKLDPVFLAELEKHLGEKEATKNTNSAQYQSPQAQPKQQHQQQQQQSAAAPSNIPLSTSSAASVSNKPADNTVIPMLRPPPQSIKPKSPNLNETNGGNFNFANKVQNSWHSKSTNIQRPRSQLGLTTQLSAESSNTDAIIAQIWQQNQMQSTSNPNIAGSSTVSASTSAATSSSFSGNSSHTLPIAHNHAPSNLEAAAHNVAKAYHQQFPSLPSPSQLNLQNPQAASAQNSSIVQRPASIAGSALSEQVYAELKQTVPNLDQLSQNEFNTLYNKTVRQNILKSYQANSNALVSATNHVIKVVIIIFFTVFI